MPTHQTNKDKPRYSKCRHFCFPFDTHNYCPTCRESGKGDDPCVTFENLCQMCASFTEEQMLKISQRKRYIKKQKSHTASSKDDELDLLGDDVDSFTGSNADLESAADNLLCPPHWGVDILFLLFPASHLVSRHFRQQFLSYLYQIWHAGLLG